MKFKTTKKAMNANYNHIIRIGYCSAQNLLSYLKPIAYSVRAEGWACDYYEVDGVLISTGYAPIGCKNMKYNYPDLEKAEGIARGIHCNYSLKYDEQKEQVAALLKEFIKSCIS